MFYYEIDFPDCDPSAAVKAKIEEKLQKIERLFDRVTSCHVAVRIPHKHKGKRFYHINIRLELPGRNIIVNREPERDFAHTDVYVAVRDAFEKLYRQVEDFVAHLKERPHPVAKPAHAKIIKFDPGNGYGFVRTREGQEFYFHQNSLVDANGRALDLGTEVRISTEQGEEGPQVTTMHIVGRS